MLWCAGDGMVLFFVVSFDAVVTLGVVLATFCNDGVVLLGWCTGSVHPLFCEIGMSTVIPNIIKQGCCRQNELQTVIVGAT